MQYSTHAATPTRSLYIHWPFCPYRCHFCPFVALAGQDNLMGVYHEALIKEITDFARSYTHTLEIDTIHFGGGTPSTYPDELLLDTFDILKNMFSISRDSEVAMEVNPGTIDTKQVQLWKQMGINRVSIGVQSLKDKVLAKLNRHQTAKQVFDALAMSKAAGIDNVSVDLILGLPGVSDVEWKELIKKVVTWPIKHVSVYCLEVHEDTALYFKVKTNQVTLPRDEESVSLYQWTCATLNDHGFKQYELSNFALPGYESRHNQVYWNRTPYKGFGIGACSFDGRRRFQNEKNIMKYMKAIKQNTNHVQFSEELSEHDTVFEHIMLNLRRPRGVFVNDVVSTIWKQKIENGYAIIEELEQQGFVERCSNAKIRLTHKGLVVENEVIAQLCRVDG